MTSIFISYRRQDASGHAGRLSDRLVARFGADHVFMDVEDIQPGQNFARSIEQTLAQCSHVLAVVGPRWTESLQARSAAGEDFLRHEIAVALTRGLTVIPVLVGGARMPPTSDLPAELSAFGRCQAVEIRDDRFDDDATRLTGFLSRWVGPRNHHRGRRLTARPRVGAGRRVRRRGPRGRRVVDHVRPPA